MPLVVYMACDTLWNNSMSQTVQAIPEIGYRCKKAIHEKSIILDCLISSSYSPADAMAKELPNKAFSASAQIIFTSCVTIACFCYRIPVSIAVISSQHLQCSCLTIATKVASQSHIKAHSMFSTTEQKLRSVMEYYKLHSVYINLKQFAHYEKRKVSVATVAII